MKEKSKEYLAKGLKWLVLIFLTLSIYYGVNKGLESNLKSEIIAQTEAALGLKEKEVIRWKDRYNKTHLLVERQKVDIEVLEATSKEQARLLGIKPKQIQGKTVVTTETFFETKFDTLYRDNYIYIEKSKDSIRVALKDTLIFTDYWKRVGFLGLGGKRYFTDIQNKNPYIKLTGLKTIELKEKRKAFTLGVSTGYDFITNRPTAGVSLIWRPLSISF